MNDDRAVFDLLSFFQCGDQRAHVMTVNVSDVLEAELVDERTWQNRGGDRVLHCFGGMMKTRAYRGDRKQCLFNFVFEPMIAVRLANAIQVSSQSADRRRDRHFIVIKNDY